MSSMLDVPETPCSCETHEEIGRLNFSSFLSIFKNADRRSLWLTIDEHEKVIFETALKENHELPVSRQGVGVENWKKEST